MTIDLTLSGPPRTKKNSQMIVQNRLIQSPQYRRYESDCIWQIPASIKIKLDRPCNVRAVYFMPTRGKVDLLNLLAATCDILVKAGVLDDDNSRIVASHDGSRVLHDPSRPRVEVTIEVIE